MVSATINHVSVLALDAEESAEFYSDVFGMNEVPAPNFEVPVKWMQAGDVQLHLFERDMEAVPYYHFGLTVDDFETVYRRAKEDDLFASWTDEADASIYRLPSDAAQMYINDPTGNLVEVDYPDIDELDDSILDQVVDRNDLRPQTGEAARATLNMSPLE